MGVSACKMGDVTKAKQAYAKVDDNVKKQLVMVCNGNGIALE